MKIFKKQFLFASLAAALLAGCGKKSADNGPVDDAALQQTFGVAAPATGLEAVRAELDQATKPGAAAAPDTLRPAVAEVMAEIRANKLPEAQTHLQTVLRRTNLNAAQYTAIQDTMAQIQGELARRAARGDAEAKRALQDFQKSLVK
ncbi:MAG: hypothetical protein HY301_18890 [Verrucomicrobia bacterium]|nr:hypothetical protein [Verrucomicrobiota bacterium]